MARQEVVSHFNPSVNYIIALYLDSLESDVSVLVRRPVARGTADMDAAFLEFGTSATIISDLDQEFRREEGRHAAGPAVVGFASSGTTAPPKCVIYDKATTLKHARAISESLKLNANQQYRSVVPTQYAYGLSILHSHFVSGVPIELLDPQTGLTSVEDELRSGLDLHIYMLPAQATMLSSDRQVSNTATTFYFAGGRLSDVSLAQLRAKFPNARLNVMYGKAELGPRVSIWNGPLRDYYPAGSIGLPIPGVQIDLGPDNELFVTTQWAAKAVLRYPYSTRESVHSVKEQQIPTGDIGWEADAGFGFLRRADHHMNIAGTLVDMDYLRVLLDKAFGPAAIRLSTAPSATGGDALPLIEIVPGDADIDIREVRRLLATEVGSLVTLIRLKIVEHLTMKSRAK